MKKMKRFLVALLSCLTAVACVAGISACKDDNKKTDANNSSSSQAPSTDININLGDSDCNHKYDVVYEVAATCETAGRQYIGCTECGLLTGEEYVEVAALGHKGKTVVAKAATCTEAGNEEYTQCQVCEKVLVVDAGYIWLPIDKTDFVIPATGHNFFNAAGENAVDAVAPTCTKDGHTAYLYCYDCMQVELAKEENMKKATTYWAKGEAFENEDPSFEAGMARVAKELLAANAIPTFAKEVLKANHASYVSFIDTFVGEDEGQFDLVVTVDDEDDSKSVEPSGICGEKGFEDFQVCAVCTAAKVEDIFEDWADAEKTSYNVNDVLAALASEGVATKAAIKEIAPEFAAHNLKTFKGVAATCTTAGYEATQQCQNEDCKVWFNTTDGAGTAKVIDILGHKYLDADNEVVVLDAGVEEVEGVATCDKAVKCLVCAVELEGEADHDFEAVADKAPTCTEDGWTDKQYCPDCGEEEMTVVKATGHVWSVMTATEYDEATCTEGTIAEDDEGKYFVCTVCADLDEPVAVYGVLSGTTTKKITVMTASQVKAMWDVKPTGHKVDEDYTPATCQADADKYECANGCGEIVACDEDEIAMDRNAHNYNGYYVVDEETKIKAKKPTCTEAGVCSVCNVVEPLDHKDAEGESALTGFVEYKAPTCTDKGTLAYAYCSICNDVAVEVVVGSGDYEYTILVYDDEADTLVEIDLGSAKKPNKDVVELAAIGHDYSVEVAAKNPTCEEVGYYAYNVCANCGAKDAKSYKEIAKVAHASTNGAYCHAVCDNAYMPATAVAGTDWDDVNENGIWDKGEEVLTEGILAGCGEVIVNTSASALHNYNADDVCILCGKKKAA